MNGRGEILSPRMNGRGSLVDYLWDVGGVGWYLGGTVGIGTLLFAFGIGPCVALGLYLVDKIFD